MTCHHEAGHALVRWYFGYGTDRAVVLSAEEVRAGVQIENRRGILVACEGMVDGYDILGHPLGPLRMPDQPEIEAEWNRVRAVWRDIELILCYAGFYAEAAHGRTSVGGCVLLGGGGDMTRARQVLDAWDLQGDARWAVCNEAERRTAALVRSRSGAAAVKAMAGALLAYGEIDGDAIAALCREAYGGRQCAFGAWNDRWPPTLAQIRAGFIPERVPLAA